ncbi:tumor necrosis factor receptor superfamily member 21 [Myripristis murdjan]|uniref:tumor necrosis factor receptor superfamily member 21 n=1 Tax=Myripristis murdjan TaxID=586833 RepID=UPI001175DCD5|nr:tumor necrosis factor receptor superfamily member 21 [Myripristis murdjan]
MGKMPVLCVSAVLLCTVVVDISARALSTISPAEQPLLSPRHYQHTDPDSGTQLVCDKCPAGTYVSLHCSPTAVRECSPCPEGTFTRGENGVQQCHRCRVPCPTGLIEKVPCTATQDRVCACPPDSFALGESGVQCKPYSLCPPGTRVKRRGSDREDVLCKPCTKGTFSDVESSSMKCQTHTDCQAQGLVLLTAGTRETDNVCGPPSMHPSSSSSSSSITTTTPLGPAQFVPMSSLSSLSSSQAVSTHEGSSSQSAAIRQRENLGGEDHHVDSVLLSQDATPTLSETQNFDRDPPRTPPPSLGKHPLDRDPQRGHPRPDPMPSPNKRAMQGLEGAEAVGAGVGISKGSGGGGALSSYYRPTRRGSPRPSTHRHFDINEHLPWMIVLLLLLVLVVIVVCSVKRSSRVLKKGPRQDPSSIMEKAIQKKPLAPPTQVKEKWIYYSNGQGVDILKLVSAQVGSQWIDIYQSLANATEREVAAFSNGYASDHERAYAALQHWTIRDSDANLAKLINALHRQRRIDVVEKIRYVMEDNPQFDINQLMTSVNVSQSLSPVHKPPESPGSGTGSSSGSGGGGSTGSVVGGAGGTAVEQSPVDRTKGFFPDESEPLLRCDSTSSKDSALSRTGSFITKEKKDTVLRQVRLDPCDLQPIFDDMLHILNPEELHVIEEIPAAEDKLDRLFEIAGVKSQEASQTLLDSVYSHLPDLL